jgi:hypothetical protein
VQLSTHLTFDSNSGSSAADASGSGHDGTLVGGATWATGRTGNAVSLNGGGCHVSLPDDLMADTGDFTIAAWIYWSASANSMRIFDFGNGTSHYMMLTPQSGADHGWNRGERGHDGHRRRPIHRRRNEHRQL